MKKSNLISRTARKSVVSLVLALMVAMTWAATSAQAAPYNTHFYKKITIDHTKVSGSDQANFPVLISLTGLNHINPGGSDIRFTLGDGTTELPREIESYSGGNLTAWVKVPTLSATVDTVVYMYYGDPNLTEPPANSAYGKNSVWDGNYKAVYHMNNLTSSTIMDSTINGNNGTKAGGAGPTEATGLIGNGQSFDGVDDRITIPLRSIGGQVTMQAVVKNTGGGNLPILDNYNSNGQLADFQLWVYSSNKVDFAEWYGSPATTYHEVYGTTALNTTDFYMTAGTWDGANINAYLNGTMEAQQAAPEAPNSLNATYTIGSQQTNATTWSWFAPATMDEIRISNVARSAYWLKTESNNWSNPAGFYAAVGPETALADSTAPTLTSAKRSAGNLVLTYAEQLDGASVPATGDFAVKVNEVLTTVTGVTINVNQATLTLATQVGPYDTASVSYSTPGAIKDLTGNAAAGFTDTTVAGKLGLYNTHRFKKITLDHTKVSGTDQFNFPVLISLTGLNHINQGGSDVRFTASDGTTELAREIESYSNGNLLAWVKVPTLSATVDTVVYMYYDDPTLTEPAANSPYGRNSVWDSNYKAVYHMSDATASTISDSTSNGQTGTKSGGTGPTELSGAIGKVQGFDGVDDMISIPQRSLTGPTTFQGIIKRNVTGTRQHLLSNNLSGVGTNQRLFINGENARYDIFNSGAQKLVVGTTVMGTTDYYFMTGSYDGSGVNIYVNGQLEKTLAVSAPPDNIDNNYFIGAYQNGVGTYGEFVNANIDEVRISDSARTANWIRTEYTNQSNPSGFAVAGSETVLPDTTLPALINIQRSGGSILINYTEELDGASIPANGDFNVTVNGVGRAVTSVSMIRSRVTLTLASAISGLDSVVVSYSIPGAIKDLAGNTAVGFPGTPVQSSLGIYNTNFYKKITIDHTKVSNTDQANFPVLISLTGLNQSHINPDGSDIRFTADDGLTELPREIESYSGGNLAAWVKVPNLSATVDTIVYMYYGDATLTEPAADSTYGRNSVWDSNYKMVQHLKDGTATTVSDSTRNNNTGTKKNGVAQNTGKIGNGQAISATNHFIDFGNPSSLKFNSGGNYTYSMWMNLQGWDAGSGAEWRNYVLAVSGAGDPEGYTTQSRGLYLRLVKNGGGANDGYYQYCAGTGITGSSSWVGSWVSSGTMVNLNNWSRVTVQVDGNIQRMFVNGTQIGQATMPSKLLDSSNIYLGASETDYQANMWVDELEVSNIARSADWIKTEYNNQNGPGTFSSAGSEVALPDFFAPFVTKTTRSSGNIVINYSENLLGTSIPATTDYTVNVNGSVYAVTNVSLSGSQVTLTLTTPLTRSDSAYVSYTPGTNPLQDISGNNAAGFTNRLVGQVNNLYFTDNGNAGSTMTANNWGLTSAQYKDAPTSWTDSPSGNTATYANNSWISNNNVYNNSANLGRMLATPVIDLSGSTSPQLSFIHRYDFYSGANPQSGV
ncbi:MAG TPA: DUF2341 domain-containing protein, partial [Bacillota bacterium]|nr:DUF2341 domain-containing protein [Bacillota bacterium]